MLQDLDDAKQYVSHIVVLFILAYANFFHSTPSVTCIKTCPSRASFFRVELLSSSLPAKLPATYVLPQYSLSVNGPSVESGIESDSLRSCSGPSHGFDLQSQPPPPNLYQEIATRAQSLRIFERHLSLL